MHKTVDRIAREAEHLDGVANIRAINRAFRAQDESHLWPIRGAFNVTERAIRRVRAQGCVEPGYAYAAALDAEMSEIVNNERNW
jgi:hypothetical protein